MKLQTQIPLQKADNQIDYGSKVLLLGSCFAENIGEKFGYYKFRSVVNPFGVLFHPMAVKNLVKAAVLGKTYSENDVFEHNETWHCFEAHSCLSSDSQSNLIANLNTAVTELRTQITKASHIIITLGTAWVYQHKETDKVVANCHKVPQKEFEKKLLSVQEIEECLQEIGTLVQSINENAQFIYTVSPVRHIKDGFVENHRSKSHLITALHSRMNPSSFGGGKEDAYFESYEIMMDELRDYRFYETDMVHPNQLAIDYIWEKFASVWINEKAKPTMAKVDEVQRGLAHKPFNPSSSQHQKFKKTLEEKIAYLQDEFPFMKF